MCYMINCINNYKKNMINHITNHIINHITNYILYPRKFCTHLKTLYSPKDNSHNKPNCNALQSGDLSQGHMIPVFLGFDILSLVTLGAVTCVLITLDSATLYVLAVLLFQQMMHVCIKKDPVDYKQNWLFFTNYY